MKNNQNSKTYKNFTEGKDYQVISKLSTKPILIQAIHGGSIEPGTEEIAEKIAGDDFSLFVFKSLLQEDAFKNLHVTSSKFGHPKLGHLTEKNLVSVSIHGCKSNIQFAMGGLNLKLRNEILNALENDGFVGSHLDHCKGESPNNVCNRTKLHGVQIELGKKFRKKILNNPELMEKFTSAVKKSITRFERSIRLKV